MRSSGLTHFHALPSATGEIARLEKEKIEMDNAWADVGQIRAELDSYKEWESTTISPLDELYDLAARFPYKKDFRVNTLGFTAGGEAQLQFPNPQKRDQGLTTGQPPRLTIRLTPPAGTDHDALLWTRGPNAVTATEWGRRIAAGQLTATERGEFVLQETVQELAAKWTAVLVQAEHRPPLASPPPSQG